MRQEYRPQLSAVALIDGNCRPVIWDEAPEAKPRCFGSTPMATMLPAELVNHVAHRYGEAARYSLGPAHAEFCKRPWGYDSSPSSSLHPDNFAGVVVDYLISATIIDNVRVDVPNVQIENRLVIDLAEIAHETDFAALP